MIDGVEKDGPKKIVLLKSISKTNLCYFPLPLDGDISKCTLWLHWQIALWKLPFECVANHARRTVHKLQGTCINNLVVVSTWDYAGKWVYDALHWL
jgi:hypothetical protein